MDSLQRDALASLRLTWAPTVDDLWKPQSATHVSGLNEHAVDDVMDAFTTRQLNQAGFTLRLCGLLELTDTYLQVSSHGSYFVKRGNKL